MSDRMYKVNALILKSLSEIITREVDLKSGVFVTLTKVDTLSDLSRTNVYVQAFPTSEAHYAMKTLEHEHARIQRLLSAHVSMKICPKVVFHPDHHGEYVEELDELIKR